LSDGHICCYTIVQGPDINSQSKIKECKNMVFNGQVPPKAKPGIVISPLRFTTESMVAVDSNIITITATLRKNETFSST